MTAHLIQIADRVVECLNSSDAQDEMVLKFESKREYIARLSKEEMVSGQAYVSVLHDSEATELLTRDSVGMTDYGVQVAIRGRLLVEAGIDSNEVLDRFMLLAEQIKDYLRRNPILNNVALTGIQHTTVFDADDMKDHNVFTTAPVFTYRAQRS